jgi:aspartyl-tRNA(Asn)/glutamyl-tRNA(Gln) amidotransferase subunit A
MSTSNSSVDLAGLDAGTMVRGYERGTFSPVDVLDAAAGRIARLDPQLNAFVARNDGAREAAEASSARYRGGQPLSPLDGVPLAIKDNLVVAGMPATWGSRVFAGTICASDELAVARLRAAGAVIIGKTNTPEFAVEGFTGNALFGVTGNPWNPSLTPGGTGWINAIGHPAIALPSEPHVDGMPIGVQLVGDLGSEDLLLDLAGCVERIRPWAHRTPDVVRRDEAARDAR